MPGQWRSCGEWCRCFVPGRFAHMCVLTVESDGVDEATRVCYGQECRFKPVTLSLFTEGVS